MILFSLTSRRGTLWRSLGCQVLARADSGSPAIHRLGVQAAIIRPGPSCSTMLAGKRRPFVAQSRSLVEIVAMAMDSRMTTGEAATEAIGLFTVVASSSPGVQAPRSQRVLRHHSWREHRREAEIGSQRWRRALFCR